MNNHTSPVAALCDHLRWHVLEVARLLNAMNAPVDVAAESLPLSRPLSAKEREIIALAHLCDKEIAHRLQMHPRTLSAHLQSIFHKLGIQTRREQLMELRQRCIIESATNQHVASTESA
jgi:DNA-binding CsgD family transcriptional regulator